MPVSHDHKQGDRLISHPPPFQSVKHQLEPHPPSSHPISTQTMNSLSPPHDPKYELKHINGTVKLADHHPQQDQPENKSEEINSNQSEEKEEQQEDQSEDQSQHDDDETDVAVPPMDYYEGMEEPKEEYDDAELNESDELQEQATNQTMSDVTNTAASISHETTNISNVEQTDEI